MTKRWRCTQCNFTVKRDLVESIQEKPTECPECAHPELQVIGVDGKLHRTIDDPRWVWRAKHTRRKVVAAGSAAFALVWGVWLFFGRPRVETTTDVEIIAAQFQPRNIEIETGDEVTWRNVEDPEAPDTDYELRSATDNWDFRAEIRGGESISHTFDTSGEYALYDPNYGDEDLNGMSMKIGVDTEVRNPLGGWF